jgi:hypothetical protein
MTLKIIQIAATEASDSESGATGTLYALVDDGSVWMITDPWMPDAKWKELPYLREPKK